MKPMQVVAVHVSAEHSFSKATAPEIELVAGHGVVGDAHFGTTVKHRSRVARDPGQPNLRQVHLFHEELFAQLDGKGIVVTPGQMGENITTRGVDLLALSAGSRLQLGDDVLIEITGLRNPCRQIEDFMPGLLAAVLERLPDGTLLRKTGVMGIVLNGGIVEPGAVITVAHVPSRHVALLPV